MARRLQFSVSTSRFNLTTPDPVMPMEAKQLEARQSIVAEVSPAEGHRATRILAKSIVKEMTAQGYSSREVVALATELLSEVTMRIAAPVGE